MLDRPQGYNAGGRIRSIEKSNDLIRDRTCDLPACNIVPQPTTLQRAPFLVLRTWGKQEESRQISRYSSISSGLDPEFNSWWKQETVPLFRSAQTGSPFPWNKAGGVWTCLRNSTQYRSQESMELYYLTALSWILLEKATVPQPLKKSARLEGLEGS
jgi:hypothetical protein